MQFYLLYNLFCNTLIQYNISRKLYLYLTIDFSLKKNCIFLMFFEENSSKLPPERKKILFFF